MSPLPPDLKDELQKEYAATFDEKLAELKAAFDAEDTRKLQSIFHKLAGSGKTYEMEAISQISKMCEDILAHTFDKAEIKEAIQNLAEIFKTEKDRLNL